MAAEEFLGDLLKEMEAHMQKSLEATRRELSTIRPLSSRFQSTRNLSRSDVSSPSTSPVRKLPPMRTCRTFSSASTNWVVV